MYTSKRDYIFIFTDVCTCMHITHYNIIYIQIIFINTKTTSTPVLMYMLHTSKYVYYVYVYMCRC